MYMGWIKITLILKLILDLCYWSAFLINEHEHKMLSLPFQIGLFLKLSFQFLCLIFFVKFTCLPFHQTTVYFFSCEKMCIPVKILGFPPVETWYKPWKQLWNNSWKITSSREKWRKITPVKTNFHPWKL